MGGSIRIDVFAGKWVTLKSLLTILFRLTWKAAATPLGRPYCLLRASTRHTKGIVFSSWVTPSARDWKDSPGMSMVRPDGRKRLDQLPRQAQLAAWPTPQAHDCTTARAPRLKSGSRNLEFMGSWRKDLCDAPYLIYSMPPDWVMDSGGMPTGCCAGAASGGQLNPSHSRWLMGLPPAWDACAPMEMPSSRKSRRNSSSPS